MNVENEFKKVIDRDLIEFIKNDLNDNSLKSKATEILLKRYERQIHKNWHRLRAQMNNSSLVLAKEEEYYEEAYEAFLVAIQKVDLSKIENDKWKFVGMLNWYLTNVRTKLIKEILKEAKTKPINYMHEISDDGLSMADPDVEESYWESEGYKNDPSYAYEIKDSIRRCELAVAKCKSNWSNLELKIFKSLLNQKSKAAIADELGCNASKVYSLVKKMKEDIKNCLKKDY